VIHGEIGLSRRRFENVSWISKLGGFLERIEGWKIGRALTQELDQVVSFSEFKFLGSEPAFQCLFPLPVDSDNFRCRSGVDFLE